MHNPNPSLGGRCALQGLREARERESGGAAVEAREDVQVVSGGESEGEGRGVCTVCGRGQRGARGRGRRKSVSSDVSKNTEKYR